MANFEQLSLHYQRGYVIAAKPIETYKTYSVELPSTLLGFYAEKLIECYEKLLPDAPQLTLTALYDEIGAYDNAPNQPRFSKRLSRWAHKRGYEIPSHQLSMIANYLTENSIAGTFYFQFSEVVDWDKGSFGDLNSCFFGSKRGALGILHNAGARPVRFYLDEHLDKPVGRCFVLPLDDASFIVFNTYQVSNKGTGYAENGTFSNSHAAAILAQFFGKQHVQKLDAHSARSIRSSRTLQNMWYNSSYVYLVGVPRENTGGNTAFRWTVGTSEFLSWFAPKQTCACNGKKQTRNCPICNVLKSRVCTCCGQLSDNFFLLKRKPVCINCLTRHYAYSFEHGELVLAPDSAAYAVYDVTTNRLLRVLPYSELEPVQLDSVYGRRPTVYLRGRPVFMRLQLIDRYPQVQFTELTQTYNQLYAPIEECRYFNDVCVHQRDVARYVVENNAFEHATTLLTFEDYVAAQRLSTNRPRGAVPLNQ